MGKPLRTNNPSEWTALDGIYIDELRPPGRITNQGSAVVLLVGQFQKGPYELTTIDSPKHLINTFGSGSYSGYKALMGRTFSNLVIARVKGGESTKAAFGTLMDDSVTPAASIVATATSDGVWGNSIKVKAMAATSGLSTECNVLATNTTTSETYTFENVTLAKLPLSCDFVKLTKADAATKIPDITPEQEVTFTQGSDGTITTTSYTDALEKAEAYDGITLVVADDTSDDVNLGLISHCNLMGDRIPIFAFPVGTDKTSAKTKVAALRGAKDRGIAVWPWVYSYNTATYVTELGNPATWAASVLSQIGEEIDPAVADASVYLSNIKGLEYTELTRQDYIELQNAGIMAFEFDKDIGYKFKSGVTVSTDTVLKMVFRRRMTDKITSEISTGLKPYQNKIMTEDNKTDVLTACTNYLQNMKDKSRIAEFSVDGESMNTQISLANGEFHILILVKLYASMRYIVLHAQIGESVTIVERSAA